MIYYAIQHKPSGWFLPVPVGRGGRGGTHVEPAPPETFPPRLFHTQHAAKVALTYWLRGAVTVSVAYDPWDNGETWHVEPRPDRVAEDMAVVPLRFEVAT